MLQASRERCHREQGVKSVQGARCCDCRRLILDTSSSAYAFWRRRVRVCMDCVRGSSGG
jgi:hypothetical protein